MTAATSDCTLRDRSLPEVVLLALAYTLAAAALSAVCFRGSLNMAATGLIAIGLGPVLSGILEENRRRIWASGESPWLANGHLTGQISGMFLAIFFGVLLLAAFNPEVYLGAFGDSPRLFGRHTSVALFKANYPVLMLSMLLGMIFGAGGMMLVVAWNAVNWAELILLIVTETQSGALTRLALFLPHLVLEAAAYILAGLAGVFLRKAIQKYRLTSPEFLRVEWAAMVILLVAVGVLYLAAHAEAHLAL